MKLFFQLGHQPHISIAEIAAVFSAQLEATYNVLKQSNTYIVLDVDNEIDIAKLGDTLGGTIKIGREIKSTGNPQKSITHFLHTNASGKIHVSVSGDGAKKLGISIKKELKGMGHSVRYIEAKNTATILHNNLVEKKGDFTIVGTDVFVTESIQDIENFGKRDYDRPGVDDKSGMLPPKLARIMINLSGAHPKSDTLLDAFCGSGTVLMEAAILGYKKIFGSDLSQKAIDDSKKNIDWMKSTYNLQPITCNLLCADATKLSQHIDAGTINAIVSEPYMGKPLRGNETIDFIKQQTQELASLYIETFKAFHTMLKDDGTIIFIIPKFQKNGEWITIDCIEQIKNIGFETEEFFEHQSSLLYHRDGQHVGREIFMFKKV